MVKVDEFEKRTYNAVQRPCAITVEAKERRPLIMSTNSVDSLEPFSSM